METKESSNVVELKKAESEAAPVAAKEVPLSEQVRAQITITLYEDGNCVVDGPFEDRVLFNGLLHIASEVDRDMYHRRIAQERRAAEKAAKEPVWKRIVRVAREKAAERKKERDGAGQRDAAPEKK